MKLFLTNQPKGKLNENEFTFNMKKISTFKTKEKALYGSTLEVKKKNPQKYCGIMCMMRCEYISLMFKQFSNSSSKKIHLR